MKELIRVAILSQIPLRSQGVAEKTRAPLIKMPPMTKICQNSFVSSFSVSFCIFAYISTRVQQYLTINTIDDQWAWRTPFIQCIPTNLNV